MGLKPRERDSFEDKALNGEEIVIGTGNLEEMGEAEMYRSQAGGYPKDLARKAQSISVFMTLSKTGY